VFAAGRGMTWAALSLTTLFVVSPLETERSEPRAVVIAGTGRAASDGDGGPATAASVNNPFGVCVAPDGGVLICEVGGHRVRRVGPTTGGVPARAGSGEAGSSGDGGPAVDAKLNEPYEIVFDAAGRWLVVDMKAHCIRRVDPSTGRIERVAGTDEPGFSGDGGPAIEARLNRPHSVAVAADGTILVCDIGNHRVRAVDPRTGVIRTLAGNGSKDRLEDGAAFLPTTALPGPRALAIAPRPADERNGAPRPWWLALREGNAVVRVEPPQNGGTDRIVRRIAGDGRKGYRVDGGPAAGSRLAGPKGLAVLPNGDLVVADTENHAIRLIEARSGTIRTILGRDADGTIRGGVVLARPHGVAAEPDGSVLVGDSENHRVLRLAPPF
ncbi:MAG: hypothetical protein AAF907_13465, partial [Planctomycetota bacterium]